MSGPSLPRKGASDAWAGPVLETEGVFPEALLRGPRSAAVDDDASALFLNPASLDPQRGPTMLIEHADALGSGASATSAGISLGSVGLGWQRVRGDSGGRLLRRYVLGTSIEVNPALRAGIAVDWSRRYSPVEEGWTGWSAGLLWRPDRFLSVGFDAANLNRPSAGGGAHSRRYVAAIALRPGTDRVTLQGDLDALEEKIDRDRIDYKLGLMLEPLDGVLAGIAYSDRGDVLKGVPTWEISAGLNITHLGFLFTNRRESEGDDRGMRDRSYSIRYSGPIQRTIFARPHEVAVLELDGELVDGRPGFSLFGGPRTGLGDFRLALRTALSDPSVAALLLRVHPVDAGFLGGFGGLAEEVNEEVRGARASGLPVVSFIETDAWGAGYYLAATADDVVMAPSALVGGLGTRIDLVRTRELGKKVGVRWELETVGKQKDTFYSMGKEPDESDLAYVKSLADLMYERMLDGIAESRGVERDTFQPFADGSLGGVRRAMEFGLVDQVGYLEDAVVLAANQGGLDARTADDVKLVEVRNRRFRSYTWAPPGRIAVIEVEGEIVSGESTNDLLFGSRSAGSETITGLLADARRDHAVKAVVLRVDSGGGSSVASDRIWREVKRVRDSGKPVVVSMGDAAASGGYYISMGADYIFANPTTLTGSIGGAWVKTNVTGLEEKAGIERDIVKRGEHVDTFSSTHEWTEDERRMVHQVMEDFQEDFIRRAAEGRGLPIDGMRELAQGQVILGAEAVDLGLVDEIGGLSRALDKAAELAGLGENWEAIFPGDTGAGWDRGGPWWTKLAAGAVRAAGFSRSSSAAGPERPAVRGARSAREVRAARPGAHWRALP